LGVDFGTGDIILLKLLQLLYDYVWMVQKAIAENLYNFYHNKA